MQKLILLFTILSAFTWQTYVKGQCPLPLIAGCYCPASTTDLTTGLNPIYNVLNTANDASIASFSANDFLEVMTWDAGNVNATIHWVDNTGSGNYTILPPISSGDFIDPDIVIFHLPSGLKRIAIIYIDGSQGFQIFNRVYEYQNGGVFIYLPSFTNQLSSGGICSNPNADMARHDITNPMTYEATVLFTFNENNTVKCNAIDDILTIGSGLSYSPSAIINPLQAGFQSFSDVSVNMNIDFINPDGLVSFTYVYDDMSISRRNVWVMQFSLADIANRIPLNPVNVFQLFPFGGVNFSETLGPPRIAASPPALTNYASDFGVAIHKVSGIDYEILCFSKYGASSVNGPILLSVCPLYPTTCIQINPAISYQSQSIIIGWTFQETTGCPPSTPPMNESDIIICRISQWTGLPYPSDPLSLLPYDLYAVQSIVSMAREQVVDNGPGNDVFYSFYNSQTPYSFDVLYKKSAVTNVSLKTLNLSLRVLVNESDFSIIPNPFHDEIIFRGNCKKNEVLQAIEVFDISSRLLWTSKLLDPIAEVKWDGKTSNGDDVPNGILFVKLKTNTRIVVKKIIKGV